MSDFPKPKIIIRKDVWNKVIQEAKKVKENGIKLKAFFLFSKRETPFVIEDAREMKVLIKEEKSDSGIIFRWAYKNVEKEIFYPNKGLLRYHGSLLIQENLEMTNHYAFWMAVDFKRPRQKGERLHIEGFNINLWLDENQNPIWKAYYVLATGATNVQQTHGKFIEADVVIN